MKCENQMRLEDCTTYEQQTIVNGYYKRPVTGALDTPLQNFPLPTVTWNVDRYFLDASIITLVALA